MSVVVPCFNRSKLVAPAVRSALAQEDVELEVLVCDDGSEDDSQEVVEGLGDDRVRWLPGERSRGPAGPRNRGVAAARHPWVAFLDSDDVWLPGKLAAQLDAMMSTGAVVCTTDAWRVVPGSTGAADRLLGHVPVRIDVIEQLRGNKVVTSSVVAATSAVRSAGGFPEAAGRTIYEDYALWLRLAQISPILGLDEPWLEYRDDVVTSVQSQMGLELRCTANALRDFRRWRRMQKPAVRTTPGELVLAARQLAGLLAVRDMVARTPWPGQVRKRPA